MFPCPSAYVTGDTLKWRLLGQNTLGSLFFLKTVVAFSSEQLQLKPYSTQIKHSCIERLQLINLELLFLDQFSASEDNSELLSPRIGIIVVISSKGLPRFCVW